MSERVKTNGGGGGGGCREEGKARGREKGGEGDKGGERSAEKKGEGANHAPANPFSGAARVHLIASLSN